MNGWGQRGSVSIVVAAVMAVVVVLTIGVADLARVLTAASRAQTASDAAALAAAQELVVPHAGIGPEALAGEYAARNGAELLACDCAPGTTEAVVTVRVDVGALTLLPGSRVVTARARAVVEIPP